MQIKSYAKINSGLCVGDKRPDGYHGIDTVMQTISLADIVDVDLTGNVGVITISVACPDASLVAGVPADESNLAVRAARAFLDFSGKQVGVDIKLVKNIPSQAGLGGGSSNAATVLTALNALFGYLYTVEQLVPIAAKLGADVPFFLYGGTCRATGMGEHLRRLPQEPREWMVIVKPPVGVSTAVAYGAIDAQRAASPKKKSKFLDDSELNSFQPVIYEMYPEIKAADRALRDAGCTDTILCGSGSAVMGYVSVAEESREANAELIAAKVRAANVGDVYIAQTVDSVDMPMSSPPLLATIVLAGGKAKPDFVAATGATNRAMAELAPGRTMLDFIVQALIDASVVGDIFIVGDVELQDYLVHKYQKRLKVLAPGNSLIDNILIGLAAAKSTSGERVLLVSADIPFISSAEIDEFVGDAVASGGDFCYPIVPMDEYRKQFAEMKRTTLKLREGEFTGGNVMIMRAGVLMSDGLIAIRAAYAARKSVPKLGAILGWPLFTKIVLSQIAFPHLLNLAVLEYAIGKALGKDVRAKAIVTKHASLGTDVDKREDVEAARRILAGRV